MAGCYLFVRPLQGLVQVFDQVLAVLHAHRKSDQGIPQPGGLAHVFGHRSMGHDGRVFHQGLDASQGLGQGEDAGGLAEALGPPLQTIIKNPANPGRGC